MEGDATPFFIMGMMTGIALTLFIRFVAARSVRKALAEVAQNQPAVPIEDIQLQRRETVDMSRRLAVLEQIITDRPRELANTIERLR
jgi:hypothetical protein